MEDVEFGFSKTMKIVGFHIFIVFIVFAKSNKKEMESLIDLPYFLRIHFCDLPRIPLLSSEPRKMISSFLAS